MSLLACTSALTAIHASLAIAGYRRTRRWLEALNQHPSPHSATPAEIAQAQSLAALASIAGRHGAIQATCMRQSLLLYSWLRRRGLRPVLNLGIRSDIAVLQTGHSFQAHAWVELEGNALLSSDANHVAFASPCANEGGADQDPE